MSVTPAENRVRLAASHWKPRFIANGIDVNDFESVLDSTSEWREWAPAWKRIGDMHRALGDEAGRAGRHVTAAGAFQRAAWSYHLGKFLWFEDVALHDALNEATFTTYGRALAHLDPAGTRVEAPFEGAVVPGVLRKPAGSGPRSASEASLDGARPPLVILVPGLDSVKEEVFAMENDFLRRGMATLAIDGPGQGENAPRFPIRADWSTVLTPLIDHLHAHDTGVDLARIGFMGISMGGIYGPHAARREKRIKALVVLAAPYDLSECWAALNPLTRGGYRFYTKSRDENEAFEKAKQLTLAGVLKDVTCPMLVIHGGKDRLFPPEQAERIVREAPNATLLLYPEGNHVCNNVTYKYRPAMADWMKERLA